MQEFMNNYGFLVIMTLLLVVMLVFSSRSRKKFQAQQEERQRAMREDLTPGTWVRTAFGFWGTFVELKGDAIVLESPDGSLSVWDVNIIREIGASPFGDEAASTTDLVEEAEGDDTEYVMGLDQGDQDAKN